MKKPTHFYIGRKTCGCCMASCYDLKDASTRRSINEFMRDGLDIERIVFADYARVMKEPGYMNCFHGQTSLLV